MAESQICPALPGSDLTCPVLSVRLRCDGRADDG